MKKYSKGFTLIELLVVIAIIGILSSIVLASLSSARTKGEDVAIQSTLSSMRTQAELYYSNNSHYGTNSALITANDNGCDLAGLSTTIFGIPSTTAGSVLNLLTDLKVKAGGAANVACEVIPLAAAGNVTAWAVAAKMKTGATTANFWCVDSAGTSKQEIYATPALDTPEEAIVDVSATCL